jgi:hypothetical protein
MVWLHFGTSNKACWQGQVSVRAPPPPRVLDCLGADSSSAAGCSSRFSWTLTAPMGDSRELQYNLGVSWTPEKMRCAAPTPRSDRSNPLVKLY